MKGRIFTAQEVQAIIAGNKKMFREVIKVQPTDSSQYFATIVFSTDKKDVGKYHYINDGFPHIISKNFNCPYQEGQKIFVKERFCVPNALHQVDEEIYGIWKPAQHMKQEHSRLTLQIKEIRVERLADINEEDAIAEGATSRPNCYGYQNRDNGWCMNWSKVGVLSRYSGILKESDICMGSAKYAFANNWNATHKKPEEKFEANPWVWVVDFEVVK
jgi:hypothetical protein